MLKLLICNSPLQDHQDEVPMSLSWSAGTSPSSTPKKSRKTGFSRSHNNKDKNPYATRGLDKFSALLADLEEKRQKIYEQSAASEDISFVRFVYKNSNDLVPIIVKLKDSRKEAEKTNSRTAGNEELLVKEKHPTQISETTHDKFPIAVKEVKKSQSWEKSSKVRNNSLQPWSMVKFDKLRRPSYYLPVIVIMILILLVFFGRSIAILCTSIGWYVVPTLKDNSTRKSSAVNKKDYVQKLSEQKLVTEGVSSPLTNYKSPRQQGHGRS